jgi:DNA transformation protein
MEFVLDQLAELRGLRCVPMFGGYGLYQDATFFGIIHRGRLYFKTDDRTRAAYVARGMKPFRPNSTQTLKSYYEVPVDILEDQLQLQQWALDSSQG